MAKRMKTEGTGITERQVISYTGPDIEPAMRRWGVAWNAKWAEGGGLFGASTLSAIKACQGIVASASGADWPPDSVEGLATRILREHELAVSRVAAGNADEAAAMAFDMGRLVATLAIKLEYEPYLKAGKALTRGGRKPGPIKSDRDRAMADAYLARRATRPKGSNVSDTQLKIAVGNEFGLGRSAAIEAINRGLNFRPG